MTPIGGALDAIVSIIGLAIGAFFFVWLLGLPVGFALAKKSLPKEKYTTVFRPFLVFGVGIVATMICFFAGCIVARLCIEWVGYPPFRIEPAAFRGGPPEWLIWRGVQLGWFTQLCIAVSIWFLTMWATAKRTDVVATGVAIGEPTDRASTLTTGEAQIHRSDATKPFSSELGDDTDMTGTSP